MDLNELNKKLRILNFHPIHVEGSASPDEAKGFTFSGNLEEYFEAARALNCSVIFIATDELEESDFSYEIKNRYLNDDNETEFEIEEIDLCSITDALKKYTSKIKEIGAFKLFSSLDENSINFYIYEDWWLEFVNLYVETVDQINNKKEEMREKLRVQKEEKNKEIIKEIRELFKNIDFRNLRTQRAMMNYASENISDINDLDPKIFKKEIQNLFDKLNTR